MQENSVVYLDQVSKVYGSGASPVYAVKNVTLEVQPGEFFSLLGSSGSGKTTTLRLIAGFEMPDAGQVRIAGEVVTTQPPHQRDVHTVFQNYALFPHLTVSQNIAYPLAIAKVSKVEIAARIQESLRMFQIEQLGDRRPSQLSGGQQQRVALARALINRPKVLLLDEPLSALDAKIREEVRQELRDLQRQTNLTFIYVTHDQEEALSLSDRIAVMHNGQIEQIGTPQDIYQAPTSLFVAQFIGKANFLSGSVARVLSEFIQIDIDGNLIQAQVPGFQVVAGDRVTVMIRPEHMQINPCATPDNQIVGKLNAMTYMGQLFESSLETPLGNLRVIQLGQPIADSTSRYPTVTLGWQTKDCILLPA
jgi:spermidine/putrescine ABC transporter ATP-binding subunit